MTGAESYSRLDRFLHYTAFKGIGAQKALADIEDGLFAGRFRDIAIDKPVFITSLPRAGTTLLLEVLATLSDFASHTYRDMPFVMCPLLWDQISRGFRKQSELRERAHGDGMEISYDSPEAFEEILWMSFWSEKYLPDKIIPWSAGDRKEEFEQFFGNHMRKIIALRCSAREAKRKQRYVSKNNANIARLELLPSMFPNCRIVIPVRNPWDHTTSLLRQHERFTALHGEDEFSRRYMEGIGHFEFGATLRPIDFQLWLNDLATPDPSDRSFWLRYWVVAYETLLAGAGENVLFLDFDRACADPEPVLGRLAEALDIADSRGLTSQSSRFRPPTRYEDVSVASRDPLQAQAQELYSALRARAL